MTASADGSWEGSRQTTVTVLGSTGSIGRQTLDVIASHRERFKVVGLAAGANAELLISQAKEHGPQSVALGQADAADQARAVLGPEIEVLSGPDAAADLAAGGGDGPADIVVNGMVGSRGLLPTLAALTAGSRVALANKESLILGGELVMRAVQRPDQLVPVDSEHSALAQCLRAGREHEVSRLILTASGGPFRGRSRSELSSVTVDDALAHPTWNMGARITVDSATLANKGLEVIEAHVLFGIPYERIDVVVHPQSVVHGMVEFCDGATVAKLSPPDMRLPIQLALGWPERLDRAVATMDWRSPLSLQFEPVDAETFPMIQIARAAGLQGGTAPGVFNAADEEAVLSFLEGRIDFLGIPAVVEAVLEEHRPEAGPPDLETVLAAEQWARQRARALISRRAKR